MKIKNIAIIAHVDHGKTTLVDQLLKNSGLFRDNEEITERMMDSNDLEKERGITILAKTTAVNYNDYKINILDTPGHADFSGEVERILSMVDGVLLVVDAYEGCMPQTKFVLKKALEQNLKPIVVVNKVDKPESRVEEVLDEVLELLIELGADDSLIEFPTVYASAINGQSGVEPDKLQENMDAIFESILANVPDPQKREDDNLAVQISMLDYNDYLGRIGIGRVYSGEIKLGQNLCAKDVDGKIIKFKVSKLFGFEGLNRIEIEKAEEGQIIAVAGNTNINVSDTIYEEGKEVELTPLRVDEPTLNMEFVVNDSPFVGKEGKHVTSSKLEERLFLETETDVSLKVNKTDSPNIFNVSGRGELHLSILVENLRREDFELQVGKPHVIIKEIDGVKCEPVEEVTIDTPDEYVGAIMESLGNRKAELKDMKNMNNGSTRLKFESFSRTLIGYNNEFMTITKGYGIYNHTFLEYRPSEIDDFRGRQNGVLVSMENGKASAYGLMQLEDRGIMLIEPGEEVYEGMIVGINNKSGDLAVNVTKTKQKTNVRSANKDNTVVLKRPRLLTLEESIQMIEDDEFCEVTPEKVRLRKRLLNKNERAKFDRERKNR
ncbi:MAG: translational GTPase TypA [Mycoplasmatales bacterium]